MSNNNLLPRRLAHEFLKNHGCTVGYSTFVKICAPSCDPVVRERYKGPPPIAAYVPGPGRNGLRPLYDPASLLAWANSLLIFPDKQGHAA
jgi:hypothetical protein